MRADEGCCTEEELLAFEVLKLPLVWRSTTFPPFFALEELGFTRAAATLRDVRSVGEAPAPARSNGEGGAAEDDSLESDSELESE